MAVEGNICFLQDYQYGGMEPSMTISPNRISFIAQLESRIAVRAESLEEIHLDAAIDAQLTDLSSGRTNANPVIKHAEDTFQVGDRSVKKEQVIFDDYVNPNSVKNCLSPFVPSPSARIEAFIRLAQLKPDDIVLDLGCGDGRVCISVVKTVGCRAIGIDVSPPCIAMARQVAEEENIQEIECEFFEADATIDPDELLAGTSPLSGLLKSATVIFFFIYPDLLTKLLPLLSTLTDGAKGAARAVATLTYHVPEENAVVVKIDEACDIKLLSKVII